MINRALFSNDSGEWETPQDLFDSLNNIFAFSLDVCASEENKKCVSYYSKDENALEHGWNGSCWMNPPYGKGVVDWVKKAHDEGQKPGCTVVCLLPARTDTKWWQKYCSLGEVFFLKGRLKFSNAKNSAPFPSAIVVFRTNIAQELTSNGIEFS